MYCRRIYKIFFLCINNATYFGPSQLGYIIEFWTCILMPVVGLRQGTEQVALLIQAIKSFYLRRQYIE
jgi:hypothetical protein